MSNMMRALVVLSVAVVVAMTVAWPVTAEVKGFTFEPGQPYSMPAHFGPATEGWDGKVAHYAENTSLSISFVTDRDAVAPLLPPGFTPTDPAIISVSMTMCDGVDYMAGRGYNLVGVSASVHYKGERDEAKGTFSLVMWENDFFPIMLGREVLGVPKLYADIPDAWLRDGKRGFAVSEYGTLMVEGEIWDLHKPSQEEMQALGEAMGGEWMGWKYIPSNDLRGAEVSNATMMAGAGETTELLVGEGKIKFHEVAWEDAPLSYRVMEGLTKLPILEYKGAVMSSGPSRLLIHKQRPMK